MSQDTQTPAAAPKKSRTLLLVVAVVVTAAGVGGGAYWMHGGPPQVGQKPAQAPEAPSAIIPMDPFVVNLADTGNPRFLRVTLGLVTHGEETVKTLEKNPVARMRLRSSILELLSQQIAAKLTSAEGKAELKRAVAERAAASADNLKVADVLFTEFIVQ